MAMKYVRVTVGGKNVCPDCIRLEGEPEKTLIQWENSGLSPRVAKTQCGSRCRCSLVPNSIEGIKEVGKQKINKFIKEVENNIITDLSQGGTVLLKNFETIENFVNLSYEIVANMESSILDWKIENNFTALPKEFFDLANIEKMTAWLKDRLK